MDVYFFAFFSLNFPSGKVILCPGIYFSFFFLLTTPASTCTVIRYPAPLPDLYFDLFSYPVAPIVSSAESIV